MKNNIEDIVINEPEKETCRLKRELFWAKLDLIIARLEKILDTY